jgi:cell division septal protein FtsQ
MAKRQYHRTAALLGAQPQVAHRAKRRWHVNIPWRWVGLPVIIVGLLLWVWLDPRWYVDASRLKIAGTASLDTARDVALTADVLTLHGLWIRPRQVISRVANSVPAVTAADVDCSFYPAECLITIEEREPQLLWQTADQRFGVDAEGILFPVADSVDDLPLLQGPLPASERIPQDILDGVEALQELGFPAEELTYHSERGLVWTDSQGTQVAFGRGWEMERRWRMYEALASDLQSRGIRPRTIDVRFPDAVTYSLTESW